MTENIIKTTNLNFRYSKDRHGVKNLNLNVPTGSIYGFLGPNGAGKSTPMRLLTGILPDDSNSIALFGQPLKPQLPNAFSKIGSLVESPALYLHLTAYENLKYIASLRNVAFTKIDEVLETVDLLHARNRKAKTYSLGMKQRLAIAMALLSEPELLLLDEPVNGLDPTGIVEMRQLLIRLNREKGISIFVSSHLLSEIEKMCTHVGIITSGELKFEGSMLELSQQFGKCRIQLSIKDALIWRNKLSAEFPDIIYESEERLQLTLTSKEAITPFIRRILDEGAQLYEFKIQDGLEEWFMSITKN
ncbi:MAG TPA: ABC transporter ATP-binding protein [Flavobacterium sp.]